MSNNNQNKQTFKNLKNIISMKSNYDFNRSYMDDKSLTNYVENLYDNFLNNSVPLNVLENIVTFIAEELKIDLNSEFVRNQFKVIDSNLDSSNIDEYVKGIAEKLSFIEDLSYEVDNSNENIKVDNSNISVEEDLVKGIENIEPSGFSYVEPPSYKADTKENKFGFIKKGFNYVKESFVNTKSIVSKQKDKTITFFKDKLDLKKAGKKLYERFFVKENVVDQSTIFLQQLNILKDLRELGYTNTDEIFSIAKESNFDLEVIRERLSKEEEKNKEVINSEDNLSKENKSIETENKEFILTSEDDMNLYIKDASGKCYSAINYKGKPWSNVRKEIPLEKFNEIVEQKLAKEYENISDVVKDSNGNILGVSENFLLKEEYENGAIDKGTFYRKDVNGKYYSAFNNNGKVWGEREVSKEIYDEALSKKLNLNDDLYQDYLKDNDLNVLIDNINKNQIENKKNEVSKEKENVENIENVKPEVTSSTNSQTSNNNISQSSVENENDLDSSSVNNFTVSNGNVNIHYFKNEEGKMCYQTIIGGRKGNVQVMDNESSWSNRYKDSIEFNNELQQNKDKSLDDALNKEKNIEYKDIEDDLFGF